MTQPLCSTTFQPLHRYYELLRPCATHPYSSPSEGHSFGFLPSHRGDRFPRSPREPEMGSRCLHAGHRPVRKQVTPGLVPSQHRCSVLMSGVFLFDASSAVHLRSSSHPTLNIGHPVAGCLASATASAASASPPALQRTGLCRETEGPVVQEAPDQDQARHDPRRVRRLHHGPAPDVPFGACQRGRPRWTDTARLVSRDRAARRSLSAALYVRRNLLDGSITVSRKTSMQSLIQPQSSLAFLS